MKRSPRSNLDNLQTPWWVWHALAPFQTDPCAGERTSIGTYNWTDGGLDREWDPPWFCNPPFSQKEKWIAKVIEEWGRGSHGILLLPERGSAPWFGSLAMQSTAHFIMGKKINFIGGPSSNNLGSVLFLFGWSMVERVNKSGLPGLLNMTLRFYSRDGTEWTR